VSQLDPNEMLELISSLRTENAELKKMLGVAPKTEHYCSACAMVHRDGKCVAPKTDGPIACAYVYTTLNGSVYYCDEREIHHPRGVGKNLHNFVASKTEVPQ